MRTAPRLVTTLVSACLVLCSLISTPLLTTPAFAEESGDGVWRPDSSEDGVWKPEKDEETDDGVWDPGDGESDDDGEDVWRPDDEDESGPDPIVDPEPIEQFYGKHFLTLEYRATDVFDDLRDPTNKSLVGPPPESLVYMAYGLALNRINYLKVEGEAQSFDDESAAAVESAPANGGWALFSWDRTLTSGARLYVDAGGYWADESSGGFNMSGEYGSSLGHNLDVAGRLQYSGSSTSSGWRVGAKANAFFTDTTALQYKGWYGWDDSGYRGSRNQFKFAQAVSRTGAFHLMHRRNVASADESLDKRSQVFEIEYRQMVGQSKTLLNVAYRWYQDNADVNAEGIALGAVQPFSRGSYGFGYRVYTSSEEVDAGSFWVLLNLNL